MSLEVTGKTIIVVGAGSSGVSAARALLSRGARVVVTDAAPRERLSAEARGLEAHGVALVVGGHEGAPWSSCSMVVLSPGVPPLAVVADVEARGVEVTSELDLGWRLLGRPPTAAIGGTNGKSTTTALVGEMLRAGGSRAFVGGNFGVPPCEVASWQAGPFARPGEGEHDALVLEVSSFQAEKMPCFRPKAAAILNVTDDHLDRYASFESYAEAKGNMVARMGEGDVLLVPHADAVCFGQAARAARGGARVVTFGAGGDVDVEAGRIVDRLTGRVYERAAIKLEGEHNALNAAAAIGVATAMGASEAAVRAALASFEGLAHRIASVATIDGVRFVDDSKGTNVGASVAALLGLPERRVVLIAGGRDKQGSYGPLVEALRAKGRGVVLIGEAAGAIEAAVRAGAAQGEGGDLEGRGAGLRVARAASMAEAVATAKSMARPGDAVLLSPACSSFDMFRDYKDRGDRFVDAVRALASATQGGAR